MLDRPERQTRMWVKLTLSSIAIVAVILAVTELFEARFVPFAGQTPAVRHFLFIARQMVTSLLLALWAAWYVLQERKRYERELRRSREHYRGLLEAIPNAVALYDSNLCLLECNAATEQLYGFASTELLGRSSPTVPPDKRTEFRNLAERARSGSAVLNVETRRQAKDGTLLDVLLSLLLFQENDQHYVLEITSDIRDRVQFRQALVQCEKLMSIGQMASGTAHHLNTPLTSMALRIRMMRKGNFEGSLGDDLLRLEESLLFCQRFVRRLLDFSSQRVSRKHPESITSTIESVVALLRPQMLAKGVEIRLELAPLAQEKVMIDRDQIEAVLLTLLANSLDASEPGGKIAVRCALASSRQSSIVVADEGRGIDPAVLPQIFEPFFTTKPVGKGTGLGLAIARSIIEEHGGSIRLESKLNEGTTAFIELPLCREVAESKGVFA